VNLMFLPLSSWANFPDQVRYIDATMWSSLTTAFPDGDSPNYSRSALEACAKWAGAHPVSSFWYLRNSDMAAIVNGPRLFGQGGSSYRCSLMGYLMKSDSKAVAYAAMGWPGLGGLQIQYAPPLSDLSILSSLYLGSTSIEKIRVCPANSKHVAYGLSVNNKNCKCNPTYVESPRAGKDSSSQACVAPTQINTKEEQASAPPLPNSGCQVRGSAAIYPLTGTERVNVETGVSVGALSLRLTYDTIKQKAAAAAGVSLNSFGDSPSFGGLWMSNMHKRLDFSAEGINVRAFRGDGSVISFLYNEIEFTASPGIREKLTRDSDNNAFTLATPDSLELYNNKGLLQSITYLNGSSIYFSYRIDQPTYLASVRNNNGHLVSFTYALPQGGGVPSDGHVTSITDTMGRTIQVGYDTLGNLSTLTWADGKVRTFVYENASLPWALTGIIDENSNRYSTVIYDANGNAVQDSNAGGVNQYSTTYVIPPILTSTTVADPVTGGTKQLRQWSAPVGTQFFLPNGRSSNLGATTVSGQNLITTMSQPAGSGCAASANAVTYDTYGNRSSRTDFDGTMTCYAYDTLNRETVRIEGLPKDAKCTSLLVDGAVLPTGGRKTTTQYEANLYLASITMNPAATTTIVHNGYSDPLNDYYASNCSTVQPLPNGAPVPLVCKMARQENAIGGNQSPITLTWNYTYDAQGRLLTATDTFGRKTSYTYYATTLIDGVADSPASNNLYTTTLLHGDVLADPARNTGSGNEPDETFIEDEVTASSDNPKFGAGSISFNFRKITLPSTGIIDVGDGNFTVETWIRPATYSYGSYYRPIFYAYSNDYNYINLGLEPNGRPSLYLLSKLIESPTAFVMDQWSHLALVRQNGIVSLYLNGINVGSATYLVNLVNLSKVEVGSFYGNLDEFRISKSAVYSGNFTPPSAPFLDSTDNTVVFDRSTSKGYTRGDLQSITNPAGMMTTFDLYDPAGRILKTTDPKGVVTEMTYTARGWVSTLKTTAPGLPARITTFTYDGVGQVTSVTTPDGASVTFTYDAAQRLIGATDAKGNKVVYTLDNMGNRISEQVKDTSGALQRQISRSFDALNRLQQLTAGQ